MVLGHKQGYLTAVVLGCVLVCAAVLALRWHALAQRDPAAGLQPLKASAGMRGSRPPAEGQTKLRAEGSSGAGSAASADAAGAAEKDEQSELNASQLRRLAGGSDTDADIDNVSSSSGAAADSSARPGSKGGRSAAAQPEFPLELNTASAAQLEAVPGIGPVLAQRILDYRRQHGAFRTLEQLDSVKGIGPKTLAELRKYLYIGQSKGH